MNKNAEVVNKIVENLFSNENESSKTKTKQCLEESIANIEMHFSNDPAKMIMFAESIAVYFQLKSQSNAGQTLASLVEIKKQAICLPKVKRAVNGFNAFNRAMKYEPKKAAAEWKALTPEAQEEFKPLSDQAIVPAKDLCDFPPFIKWSKDAFNLNKEHNIHIVSIVAHVHERGRVVDPLVTTNSAPGQKLYAEIAALNAALPERLERLAIEDQLSAEELEQSIVAHTAKRAAAAVMEGEKKRGMRKQRPQGKKYPSEIAKEENLKVIKENLTKMIWSCIPREGPQSNKLFLTHFDEEGVYQKGQRRWKFNNWPVKPVHGLRGYKNDELQILRNALEKGEVTLTELK